MQYFILFFSFFPGIVYGSFFQIDYPNVNVSAEPGGDLTFEAGIGGDVILKPGAGGTVIIAGTDLRKFIEKVKSLPPIWTKQSVHGSLGAFTSGTKIAVSVEAMDPDGGKIQYKVISGHLPPGTSLNSTTGVVSGTAPDIDASYTFGIRATDQHGKYADGTFSIDIREKDQCISNPCQNGGTCSDDFGRYKCTCSSDYGGERCELRCDSNPFGVDNAKKTIPDAQMSAHYTFSNHFASNGRLHSRDGWIGESTSSWLQVDLGEVRSVYSVATQGYRSSTYYTLSYKLQYSTDGNSFHDVIGSNGSAKDFFGSSSYDSVIKHYLPSIISARFIRFVPLTWHTGGKPGLRVEVYGC